MQLSAGGGPITTSSAGGRAQQPAGNLLVTYVASAGAPSRPTGKDKDRSIDHPFFLPLCEKVFLIFKAYLTRHWIQYKEEPSTGVSRTRKYGERETQVLTP
jgi:hypothetical protein